MHRLILAIYTAAVSALALLMRYLLLPEVASLLLE
jgi:hypothetical protein